MAVLEWDVLDEREYENGADHGILFPADASGEYQDGVVWNGLTTVTESPSGAESNKQYADNIVYVDIQSAEQFAATIEAFMSPPEFDVCDGSATINGVQVGQQSRRGFAFYWRTNVGTAANPDAGFKHHFAYGLKAAPSEKAHATVNDSPEAAGLSWECSSVPVNVGTVMGVEYRPTAKLTINSLHPDIDPDALATLLEIVYGTEGADSRIPMPSEIFEIMGEDTFTEVNLSGAGNFPTYVSGTHVITLPAVTGVQWQINGVNKANGAQPALGVGTSAVIEPVFAAGYKLLPGSDDDWVFDY